MQVRCRGDAGEIPGERRHLVELLALEVARLPHPLLGRRARGEAAGGLARVEGLGEAHREEVVEDRPALLLRDVVEDHLDASARDGRVQHLELLVEQRVPLAVEALGTRRLDRQLLILGAATARRLAPALSLRVPLGSLPLVLLGVLLLRLLLGPHARDDAPGALVGGRVGEEVEQEDVVELEALRLEDREGEGRLQLERQVGLRGLFAQREGERARAMEGEGRAEQHRG